MKTYDFELFVDCGAPSLYNKLSKKEKSSVVMGSTFKDRKYDSFKYAQKITYRYYRRKYINFLKKNRDKIDFYSNLDVINNAELTLENQRVLEESGLFPIPVYHLGEPFSYLEDYIKNYDYVAIGGLIPNRTKDLIPALNNIFQEYILDKQGFPKVRVHAFACTSPELVVRYPWKSVDSTTARKLAMYGHIYMPETNNLRVVQTITLSSRPIVGKNNPDGFFDEEEVPFVPKNEQLKIKPKVKERIQEYSSLIGSDWNLLCDDYMERMLFNHIYFSDLVHHRVPAWPWSFPSRKSKKGADEQLSLYIAGCFSKKEEDWFWEQLCSRPQMGHGLRKRLHSFFYQNQVEHLLDLKEIKHEQFTRRS